MDSWLGPAWAGGGVFFPSRIARRPGFRQFGNSMIREEIPERVLPPPGRDMILE